MDEAGVIFHIIVYDQSAGVGQEDGVGPLGDSPAMGLLVAVVVLGGLVAHLPFETVAVGVRAVAVVAAIEVL